MDRHRKHAAHPLLGPRELPRQVRGPRRPSLGPAKLLARLLSLARGDLGTDGRVDLALLSRQGPARVLWNELEPRRWIALRLRPAPRREDVATPPERLGARGLAKAGELRQTAWPIGAGGLRVRAELRFPLGLGHNERVDTLRVAWPSGRVDVLRELETNRELWIEEDRGEPEKRPGARPRSRGTKEHRSDHDDGEW